MGWRDALACPWTALSFLSSRSLICFGWPWPPDEASAGARPLVGVDCPVGRISGWCGVFLASSDGTTGMGHQLKWSRAFG